MTGELPQGFADLSPFLAAWGAVETQEERYLVRQNSRMGELRRFYEALVPRIGAALDHLDRFPVDAPLPPPELALYRLTLGLTEAAAAVEIYGRPEVPSVPRPHHVATSWSDGTG